MHQSIRPDGVAVVTGAAAGIGFAIAARLAGAQMRLVLCDKDARALERAASRLRAETRGVVIQTVVGDIADIPVQRQLYATAVDQGEVALLVNNAAVPTQAGPWDGAMSWRAVMEVNFWSALALQQLFVPRMIAQTGASAIVNVGSKEGITTPPGNAAYSVSKASLRVLTEQLAHELRNAAQGRVSAHLLVPGYTFTPMNFPGTEHNAAKPDAPWTADQVAQRMLERMDRGDFYLFCEDNETSRELDQRRMQWSADDLILNRPALSRWDPAFVDQFAAFVSNVASPAAASTHPD